MSRQAELGATCNEETPLAVEIQQGLPPLALPVLDHVSLIQNEILPLLPPKHLGILYQQANKHCAWHEDIGIHVNS